MSGIFRIFWNMHSTWIMVVILLHTQPCTGGNFATMGCPVSRCMYDLSLGLRITSSQAHAGHTLGALSPLAQPAASALTQHLPKDFFPQQRAQCRKVRAQQFQQFHFILSFCRTVLTLGQML